MSSSSLKRKAKDKAYYIRCAKQAKKSTYELGTGVRGFLCTSNNREKESIREAYNLLNEFADKLYGEEKFKKAAGTVDDENEGSDEIEDELNKEVADLKTQATSVEKRFQSMQTGVKSCCFIKTTVESPVELMNAIMKDIEQNKQQKTRFLLRMLPILVTCKPVPDDIIAAAKPIVDQHLGVFKSFSILYKVRNNSVKREEVIEPMANYIKGKFPEIKVDLDGPEVCVVVEIIRKVCCIGFVENYFGRAKYNLVELVSRSK